MRACAFAPALRKIVHKRVAAAPASRGGTGQIIIWIEPGIRFAALGRAVQQVMREGCMRAAPTSG